MHVIMLPYPIFPPSHLRRSLGSQGLSLTTSLQGRKEPYKCTSSQDSEGKVLPTHPDVMDLCQPCQALSRQEEATCALAHVLDVLP